MKIGNKDALVTPVTSRLITFRFQPCVDDFCIKAVWKVKQIIREHRLQGRLRMSLKAIHRSPVHSQANVFDVLGPLNRVRDVT